MKKKEITVDTSHIDRNFLKQSPVEILPESLSKKTSEIRIGNIKIIASEVVYQENNLEKRFKQIPYTQYDRALFYYLLKLVKSNKSKRIFKYSKYRLTKELSSANARNLNSNMYKNIVNSLLRWFGCSMVIDGYFRVGADGKQERVDIKVFRVISGLCVTDNNIEFEVSKFFTDFVSEQKFTKALDFEDYKRLKGCDIASQLYNFCVNWTGNTVTRFFVNLQEALGLKAKYGNSPPSFFQKQLVRAIKRINRDTNLNVTAKFIKEPVKKGVRPMFTKVQLSVEEKEDHLEDYREYLKLHLDFDVYNFFSEALNTIISDARLKNMPVLELRRILEYTAANRVLSRTADRPKSGTIKNPVGYIRDEIKKFK